MIIDNAYDYEDDATTTSDLIAHEQQIEELKEEEGYIEW